MSSLRPPFVSTAKIKPMVNIGALLDVPTGHWLLGQHGEHILNGGLGTLTGISGIANSFKSTTEDYMMLSAMDKVAANAETSGSTYDTELTRHIPRMSFIASQFDSFKDRDIVDTGEWLLTDRLKYYANEWYEVFREFLKNKKADENSLLLDTPFIDPDTGKLFKMMPPTFTSIDSFTAFETEDVAKIQSENELGESGGNTIHMRQGLAKMRFMMNAPTECARANHYLLLTAHLGKNIDMASGPFAGPPVKKLQFLKNGDKIKGVTDQFFFLMSNFWHIYSAVPLLNDRTKAAEYPLNSEDNTPGDTDLNIASLRQLRGKSGMTGYSIDLIISQTYGIQPSLTEFHYIKKMDRFGLSGSTQNYSLDIYPGVNLSRTTVRGKLDQDPKLRRAMNITSEICQMHQYMHRLIDPDILCDPKTLFNDLSNMGWNMDELLNTRGWWTLNNDKHPIPFLSSMDLLMMRDKNNPYKPYWASK